MSFNPFVATVGNQPTPLPVSAGGTGLTASPITRALGGTGLTTTPAAPVSLQPGNPTGTTSATLVMMGVGGTVAYTPTSSGKVVISVSGALTMATTIGNSILGGRYGTGTAPINGAAVTGTRWGNAADMNIRAVTTGVNGGIAWSLDDILSLTANTAYWFDIALSSSAGGTAAVLSVGFAIFELS